MLAGIERWLDSWSRENPANSGVQWKCGQETAIRLMQGQLAAELLQRWGGVKPRAAWYEWLAEHCERIEPTMLYAVAQDNNHGTSEAAALFIGGLALASAPDARLRKRGQHWHALGRRWMEDRLHRLVMPDGSFSQHSTNYHRVMLDTCCLVEIFRRWHGAAALSESATQRCQAATRWLWAMTDPLSGDCPNLGANDGARLAVLHGQPYRDFRPSVQLAACLFLGRATWEDEALNEPLQWLRLPIPAHSGGHQGLGLKTEVQLFADGGYAKLSHGADWALLRLPRYRFRPSHADALHLDLWIHGRNVLCDAGSFGYNTTPERERYFSGTESHNTVQFDQRDQMPRLSRFLFGDWLTCELLDVGDDQVRCAYRDARGARHQRTVSFSAGRCLVTDEVSGGRAGTVLRWHLPEPLGTGLLSGNEHTSGKLRIQLSSDVPVRRLDNVQGWRSPHYAEVLPGTTIEMELPGAAVVSTEITWTT